MRARTLLQKVFVKLFSSHICHSHLPPLSPKWWSRFEGNHENTLSLCLHVVLVDSQTYSPAMKARTCSSKAADKASQELPRAFCGKTWWKCVNGPHFWTSLPDKRFLCQTIDTGKNKRDLGRGTATLAQLSFLLLVQNKGVLRAWCNYKKLLRIGKCRTFPKDEFIELQHRHPRKTVEAATAKNILQRATLC